MLLSFISYFLVESHERSVHWGTSGWRVRWQHYHPSFDYITGEAIGVASEKEVAEAVANVQGDYNLLFWNCNAAATGVLRKLRKPVSLRLQVMSRPWMFLVLLAVLLICQVLLILSREEKASGSALDKCEEASGGALDKCEEVLRPAHNETDPCLQETHIQGTAVQDLGSGALQGCVSDGSMSSLGGGRSLCGRETHELVGCTPCPKPEARKGPPDLHPRRRHPITRCDHKGWGPFHYLNIGEIDPAPLCGPERVLAHLDARLEVEDQWVLTPIYYTPFKKRRTHTFTKH